MKFVGYSAGGVLASLVGLALLSATGFGTQLWIRAAPALVLVPLLYFLLPGSYVKRRGRVTEAERLVRDYGLEQDLTTPEATTACQQEIGALRHLLGSGRIGPLILFSIASFTGLMLVYGLNNWLLKSYVTLDTL